MNINELAKKYEDFKSGMIKHSEMQLTDNNELIVYGCKSIAKYDENYIKLGLASFGVSIDGLELKMSNFSNGGVIIRGKIHSITFLDTEEL